jgi:hypothetical protein
MLSNFYNFFEFLGYLSLVFHFYGFYTHNRQKMLISGFISALLLGFTYLNHFALMGLSLTILSLLSKSLNLFLKREILEIYEKYLHYFIFILSFIFLILFIPIEGYRAILPIFGLIFVLISDNQKDILYMKYFYIGSALSWLSYAYLIHSIPAILYDVIGIIILIYTIHKIKNK